MIKRKKIRYISLHFEHFIYNKLLDEDRRIMFNENSRFISNYLSKAVRKLNLEAFDGEINMLGVNPCKAVSSYQYLAEHVLAIRLQLSEDRLSRYYQTMDLVSRYEFYLSLLEEGYRMAEPLTGIPAETLIGLHDQFRKLNYKNEWLVKKMLIREYAIGIILTACFTTVDFHLRLTVYNAKSKETMSETVIYRTPPYEVCYEKDIRKVYAQDGYLYIDDFLDRHFLRMPLDDICKGIFSAERLLPGGEDYEESIKRITW